jgi:hypothetical protein
MQLAKTEQTRKGGETDQCYGVLNTLRNIL